MIVVDLCVLRNFYLYTSVTIAINNMISITPTNISTTRFGPILSLDIPSARFLSHYLDSKRCVVAYS